MKTLHNATLKRKSGDGADDARDKEEGKYKYAQQLAFLKKNRDNTLRLVELQYL